LKNEIQGGKEKMSPNPVWDSSLAFYRKFTPSVEDRDLWIQPLKISVWRWFKSQNVVDLYRHRDTAELQRIGRMLRHHPDTAPDAPKSQSCAILSFPKQR
jgi:hypothetical protein